MIGDPQTPTPAPPDPRTGGMLYGNAFGIRRCDRDVRACRRCDCVWADALGDIACWFCGETDSEVIYDRWTSGQIMRVEPLPPLPGDTDDPVFAPPGTCYPAPMTTSADETSTKETDAA